MHLYPNSYIIGILQMMAVFFDTARLNLLVPNHLGSQYDP